MAKILQRILAWFVHRAIEKYRPQIIGITGSVGKTSTREAVFAVLKTKFDVRTGKKNFNTEIGLSLSILGLDHYGRNIFKWAFALVKTWIVLRGSVSFPKILVLEYGIDHPGDMDYLLSIAKPDVVVITAIGDIPVHVEFFKNAEAVVKEKRKLVAALSKNGVAVLNLDDPEVYGMRELASSTITFGFGDADIRIENYELHTVKHENFGDISSGISFKIHHGGRVVPFRLSNCFGKPQAYAGAAAAAVGVYFGMNLIEIAEALRGHMPPAGRMRLLEGINHSQVLDDSYNAAPEAMEAALGTLKELPGRRKIAVLGDMLEIGKYAERAHRLVGNIAGDFVDLLVVVGPNAKFIAQEAQKKFLGQVIEFNDSKEAAKSLARYINTGDLILIKGSQSMRMERIVYALMAQPERAKELLVRQDKFWKRTF